MGRRGVLQGSRLTRRHDQPCRATRGYRHGFCDSPRELEPPDETASSGLKHGHGCEPLEPVGAGREHGGNAVSPALAGARVLHDERAVAQQRLDPRPFAPRCDAGPEVPPGLGSTLDGEARHDCMRTARRPSTRRPVRARSAARARSTARNRSRSSESSSAAGPSAAGIVSGSSSASGIAPSARKKCRGRVAHSDRPASSAPRPLTPGQWSARSTRSSAIGLVAV